jgi:hypothetical protein
MHFTALVSVALVVLSDALPQNGSPPLPKSTATPKVTPAPNGNPLANFGLFAASLAPVVSLTGGLFGLNKVQTAGLVSFLKGVGTGDLRGLGEFLKFPDFPKTYMGGLLVFLDPLFRIPEIQKYGPLYLDWRNTSTIPFLAPMEFGPIPTGCSAYEVLIGQCSHKRPMTHLQANQYY